MYTVLPDGAIETDNLDEAIALAQRMRTITQPPADDIDRKTFGFIETRAGRHRARLKFFGRQYLAVFDTRKAAEDWLEELKRDIIDMPRAKACVYVAAQFAERRQRFRAKPGQCFDVLGENDTSTTERVAPESFDQSVTTDEEEWAPPDEVGLSRHIPCDGKGTLRDEASRTGRVTCQACGGEGWRR